MTRHAHNLMPVAAPTIALSEDREHLHLHLPGDLAFNEGVDIGLDLDGLRLLRDMLERHEMLKRAEVVRDKGCGFNGLTPDDAAKVLDAFRRAGSSPRKVADDPQLARIIRERRERERALNASPPRKTKAERDLEELGIDLNDIELEL